MKNGGWLVAYGVAALGVIWIFTRHDHAVFSLMRSNGLRYGCDWIWAQISECDPAYVAQPKIFQTGEVLRVPFMGVSA